MCLSDFTHYFSRVQVCHIHDDYKYSYLKAEHEKGKYSVIRLNVPKMTEQYISVCQVDERCFARESTYKYSCARLIIASVDDDGNIEYIVGKMKVDRDMWEKVNLYEGDYLIFVEMDWVGEEVNEFVVSAYGDTDVYWVRDERE
jgi:hypothetical protein